MQRKTPRETEATRGAMPARNCVESMPDRFRRLEVARHRRLRMRRLLDQERDRRDDSRHRDRPENAAEAEMQARQFGDAN